jgi:hypothetical protein
MTAERESITNLSLAVHPDRPLIGIILIEDGDEVVRYFTDEAEADAAVAADRIPAARVLAGAWNDLDWGETVEDLDRIRRESSPTPFHDKL